MKPRLLISIAVVLGALTVIALQRYSLVVRGEKRFAQLGCTGCHFSGAGPNLTHVVRKHDENLLKRFIMNPNDVYRERGGGPLNAGYMLMPNVNASPEDVHAIIAYLKNLDRE